MSNGRYNSLMASDEFPNLVVKFRGKQDPFQNFHHLTVVSTPLGRFNARRVAFPPTSSLRSTIVDFIVPTSLSLHVHHHLRRSGSGTVRQEERRIEAVNNRYPFVIYTHKS